MSAVQPHDPHKTLPLQSPSPDDHRPVFFRPVMAETIWVSFICMADLLTTLYFIGQGHAWEANPLMRYFLQMGTVPFIVAKVMTFVPALSLAEWYSRYKPDMVRGLLRWVIIGYLALYIAGTVGRLGSVLEFYEQFLPF